MFDCTNQMLYNGIQHKKSLGQKIIRKSLMRDYDCEVIHFYFSFYFIVIYLYTCKKVNSPDACLHVPKHLELTQRLQHAACIRLYSGYLCTHLFFDIPYQLNCSVSKEMY